LYLVQRLETYDLREFVEDWYSQPLFVTLARDEELLHRTIEARLQNDPHELARSLRAMGTGIQTSLWEELPSLSVPTLVVAGEEDKKFMQIAREMERASERRGTSGYSAECRAYGACRGSERVYWLAKGLLEGGSLDKYRLPF
jgi:pimeloyl-ACP methyl ester carboxylesterase